jgi:two-component system response regulator AtoC
VDRDDRNVDVCREGMEDADNPDTWLSGCSPAMREVIDIVEGVAATDVTVLTWGESGVGKEMIPRLLHHHSPRRYGPFVKVNCAALPLELLESELFGYERGAFTGAHRAKPGKFEQADKGTIFLDEISELPSPLQAKLLHVLQDREYSRLGGQHSVRIDVRVVAATNQDLARLVEERRFRGDLYYRLNVVNIHVPPLRRRREEIPRLVERFATRFAAQYGRERPIVSHDTMTRFMTYSWPGNIRELENIVKRLVVLRTDGWIADALREAVSTPPPEPERRPLAFVAHANGDDTSGLKEIARRAAAEAERRAIVSMLERVGWNRKEASRRLKVNYKTLLQKLDALGLAPHRQRVG